MCESARSPCRALVHTEEVVATGDTGVPSWFLQELLQKQAEKEQAKLSKASGKKGDGSSKSGGKKDSGGGVTSGSSTHVFFCALRQARSGGNACARI